MDEMCDEVHTHNKGEFFGCYLLVSKHPKYKGRTYIGYTVDPKRRIGQHNGGCLMGGAKKTSQRGPWEMVFIVHGFPSDIAALKFEWAWQNPFLSRNLARKVSRRRPKETHLQHQFTVLSVMLTTPPWSRLPLTLRWLDQEYQVYFPPDRPPPPHMPVAYGPVEICKDSLVSASCKSSRSALGDGVPVVMEEEEERGVHGEEEEFPKCTLCLCEDQLLCIVRCYHKGCTMRAHATCLAPRICEAGQVIPVAGLCPGCGGNLLWGELVRRAKGQRGVA